MIFTVYDLMWHQSLSITFQLITVPFSNNPSCQKISMKPILKKYNPEVCVAFSGADLCPREADTVSNYNCLNYEL